MRKKIWYIPIWFIFVGAVICNDSAGTKYNNESSCWMSLRGQELFRVMDKINKEFAATRINAQQYLNTIDFNKRLLETSLVDGVVAQREVPKEKPHNARMPGGLQLGGQCMMRMPNSVLFFHRLAIRNDTFFRVNVLHNDMENMVLKGHLSLNGLHLMGGYDRFITDRDSSVLIYSESFGHVQFFLEDIIYTIEGRYRLVKSRILIELIVSSLSTKKIMMTYANANETDPPVVLGREHSGEFLSRLKTDLDKWVQDYLNSYLIVTDLTDIPNISSLRQYDEIKNAKLAVYTDIALATINKRIRTVAGPQLRVPKFKIIVAYGLTFEILGGTLRGLDTMYRRSVATTTLRRDTLRYVDTIIGFKDLKISYQYEVRFPPGPKAPPPLSGVLTMSANDLMARLSIGLLNEPEVVDLDIVFLNPMGPESIKIEGSANILTSNFKNIINHEIATIMSNSLMYGVGLLRTLPRCVPLVPGMNRKRKLDIYKIPTSTTYSYSKDEYSKITTLPTAETIYSKQQARRKYTTQMPKMA